MSGALRTSRAAAWIVGLSVALASGCASYSETHLRLRDDLSSGNLDDALGFVQSSGGGADRLLGLLESGMIHHAAGRWQASNAAFQSAEDLAEDLYTRSVSQAAVSLITNDTTISYRADPFERAMIPYFRAFNYINLGDRQAAQVEARKASLVLSESVEALFRAEGDLDVAPEDLQRNAFLLYFSGLIYEWTGEFNDAFVAYRNAARAYHADRDRLGVELPRWLAGDLRRTADRLGFGADLAELEEEIPGLEVPRGDPGGPNPERGTVAVFIEGGWIPHQEQRMLNLPILTTDRYADYDAWASTIALRAGPGWAVPYGISVRYWLTVALPELVDTGGGAPVSARVTVQSTGTTAESRVVEDLAERTREMFEATYPKVLTKTIVRALVKWAASEGARREDEVAGALVNLAGVLTERADTRSWLTLPSVIALARLDLPPGRYDLEVSYRDAAGRLVASEVLTGVEVVAGDWSFYSRRVF